MASNCGRFKSVIRIFGDHGGNKLDGVFLHVNLSLFHSSFWLSQDSGVPNITSLVERLLTSKHHEEHYTSCEDVRWGTVVLLSSTKANQLGTHVVGSPTLSLQDRGTSSFKDLHQPEVSDLYFRGL